MKSLLLLILVGIVAGFAFITWHEKTTRPLNQDPAQSVYPPELIRLGQIVSNTINVIKQERAEAEELATYVLETVPQLCSNAFLNGVFLGSVATIATGCDNVTNANFGESVEKLALELLEDDRQKRKRYARPPITLQTNLPGTEGMAALEPTEGGTE